MGVWDSYISRLSMRGNTKREVQLNRGKDYIDRKISSSLSYQVVEMNGESCELAIINTQSMTIKSIFSMPGFDIVSGSLIHWFDSYWLVRDVDVNNELYARASMEQCNHLLKWISDDGVIVKRWSIVDDGTKYMIGETSAAYNSGNGMSLGDTRISVSIARDEETVKLNRSNRFLIDDEDSENVLAYRLTKPFKIGGVYEGNGVMTFILTEVNTEDSDNFDLRIADYYKHFPRDDGSIEPPVEPPVEPPIGPDPPIVPDPPVNPDDEDEGKKVWL